MGRHHSHSDQSPDHSGHGGHGAHGGRGVPRALGSALAVTLTFMLVEGIGGYLANSLALMSDAAHMLADAGALSLSLFVYWLSRRPSSPSMSFGYHRAEILGALFSGVAIWVIVGVLGYEAVQRLSNPPEVRGPMAFGIAAIGLIANIVSMKMLHHEQAHNMNVRAAYLHVLMDCLGSVGALLSGLIIWTTGWFLADPLITLTSMVLMLYSSWTLVREAIAVLMEGAPAGLDPLKVASDLKGLAGVSDVHDLHIWTVSSGRPALSVHLISEDEQVLERANQLLERQYGIIHTTVQVEHPERFRSERCYDCGVT